ncbi:hypothetical protein [Pseudomonas donghuensis]|uniref:hypothetical protein n=1 Tax=Pseudomonas donghuensis TaxID=1163398 RepID=UPI0021602122|nr:hypothetical protein [Pseudomonas donghuensis]UVL26203.1 hypothetical protein LOY30_09550 [Pseudomonas donghuensis]
MKKSDFDYETDEFQILITRTAHNYKRATERYLELVETWAKFPPEQFGGQVSFEVVPEEFRVSGQVIGQEFKIRSRLLINGQGAFLRAAITVDDSLSAKEVEIGSFLVSQNGSVHSEDGELLVDRNQHLIEYSLLVAILRRVLSITTKD